METFSPNLAKGRVQRPVSFTKNDLDHPLLTARSSYCIIRELFYFNKLVFEIYIIILKKINCIYGEDFIKSSSF